MAAAGLIGHNEVTSGLLGNIRALEKHIYTETQNIALDAAVAGEQAAKDTIDNTPSGLRPGKPNRNWTFKMRQSLDSDVKRRGNTITLRAGWLNIKEGYFLLQERGFTKGAITVAPMHALQAAHLAMTKHLTRSGVKLK
jgi:hypothetical protein